MVPVREQGFSFVPEAFRQAEDLAATLDVLDRETSNAVLIQGQFLLAELTTSEPERLSVVLPIDRDFSRARTPTSGVRDSVRSERFSACAIPMDPIAFPEPPETRRRIGILVATAAHRARRRWNKVGASSSNSWPDAEAAAAGSRDTKYQLDSAAIASMLIPIRRRPEVHSIRTAPSSPRTTCGVGRSFSPYAASGMLRSSM